MALELIVIALLGGLTAALANRGIAVFNDGLRPIMPEYLEGRIGKKEIAATSFALSFGLVVGFGIPVSLGASIILVHSILLMTDIIGTWAPSGIKGTIVSAVIGAAFGVGLVLGLEAVVTLFGYLPVDFLGALSGVGGPIVLGFSVFPAVAIAYQHGFKKGGIAFVVSVLALFIIRRIGSFTVGNATIALNAEGMTLLIGMVFMIIFAVRVKGAGGDANQSLMSVFLERVTRIRKNWILLCITGGLVSAATSLLIIAGDPISLNLLSEGQYADAALAAFARGIGFVPLIFSTAIVTGVYSPVGVTFVFAIGIVFRGNPLVDFLLGAAMIFVEIMLLNVTAKGLDKFPGIRDMGEHIRSSMNKVLEIALLVGGATTAQVIAPGIGFFWVFGLYLLNRTMKKPIVDLAVGPVAAISLGIIVNILYLVGLFNPPG